MLVNTCKRKYDEREWKKKKTKKCNKCMTWIMVHDRLIDNKSCENGYQETESHISNNRQVASPVACFLLLFLSIQPSLDGEKDSHFIFWYSFRDVFMYIYFIWLYDMGDMFVPILFLVCLFDLPDSVSLRSHRTQTSSNQQPTER